MTLNGFQDRRIRPLCQLSGAKVEKNATHPSAVNTFFGIFF